MWKLLREHETPICCETGDWDGKRSSEIIVILFSGEHRIVRFYEGFLDGSDFFEAYCTVEDVDITDAIEYWRNIPDFFE